MVEMHVRQGDNVPAQIPTVQRPRMAADDEPDGGDVDDIEGEWVDEDDDDDEDDEDYGLPKLKGEDVCVVVDKSGVHRIRVFAMDVRRRTCNV